MENPFPYIEARWKVRRTDSESDAPGVHAAGSFHYQQGPWKPSTKEARDYGTSLNRMTVLVAMGTFLMLLARVGKGYRGYRIREVFGPFPFYVKDGKVYKGRFPNHGDHVHIALSD